MQYKDNKNIGFKAGKADKNFTEEQFTSYTGLAVILTNNNEVQCCIT